MAVTTSQAAATGERSRAAAFEVFRFRAYRVVWLGNFLFAFSFLMSKTAQSVVAYDLTGSNSAVGLVLFCLGISMLLLLPFGGAIADRFSKKRLVLNSQLVFAVFALITAFLLRFDLINLPMLAIGTLVMGTMFAVYGPARMALIGVAVPSDRMSNAVALAQVSSNFGGVSGPFITGLLLSIAFVGSTGTYFVIAAIMFSVFILLSNFPDSPPPANKSETSIIHDLRSGLSYIVGRRALLHAVLTFHIVMIVGFSYNVVLPGFVKDVLDAGNLGLGILFGAAAAGGLVMSLFVSSLADSRHAPLYLVAVSLVAGVALIFTGLAPSLPFAALAMVFATGGITAYHTLGNAYALRLSEPLFHGRVLSYLFMAIALVNTLSLPVGIIADEFGERAVLIGSGVLVCIIVLLLEVMRPKTPVEAAARYSFNEAGS